jgi:hypothetical protein
MQRRKFIVAIVNTLAGAPMFGLRLVSAQQAEKVRYVGVLMALSESNPEHRNLFAAFLEKLARLGWVDGRTARIEQQWTDGDVKRAVASGLVSSRRLRPASNELGLFQSRHGTQGRKFFPRLV